jgi:molecular chaperone DnaK
MDQSQYAIGIDLGTSTSEIAVYRDGKVELIASYDTDTKQVIVPSVVAMSFNNEILVGERATSYLAKKDRSVMEVKRKMGSNEVIKLLDKEYKPQEISAFILLKLKDYAEKYLQAEVKDVVVSVPAAFTDSARKATMDAVTIAGLNVVYIVNEPTAAALAYGVDKLDQEEELLVFDFGGGTLDISILSMVHGILDVQYSEGDPNLGGKDMNEALSEYILDKYLKQEGFQLSELSISDDNRQSLIIEAEKTKKALSKQDQLEITIDNFCRKGNDIHDLKVAISRNEFEQVIKPLLDRAKHLLDSSIKNSKVDPTRIKEVLLVGGTTYIPAVQNLITDYFQRSFNFSNVNPDEAVAKGAAIKAADKMGLLGDEGLLPLDVCSRTLGVSVLIPINSYDFHHVDSLILKNTKIPKSVTKEYSLVFPNQERAEIRIFQGDGHTEEQCEFVCSGWINDIPHSKTGEPHKVIVEFSYDIDTIARVKASIPATNQSLSFSEDQSDRRLSKEEVQAAQERIEGEWKQNEKEDEYQPIIHSAEELLSRVIDTEDQEQLKAAIDELKNALSDNNKELINQKVDKLSDKILELQSKY